jgi:hypothetical protein
MTGEEPSYLEFDIPHCSQFVSWIRALRRKNHFDGSEIGSKVLFCIQAEIQNLSEKENAHAFRVFRHLVAPLGDALDIDSWQIVKTGDAHDDERELFITEFDLGFQVWSLELLLTEDTTFKECQEKIVRIENFFSDTVLPQIKVKADAS